MKDIFLVDADDTILDFHGVAQKAVRHAFESVSVEWKEEYALEYALFNAKLWEALERKEITRTELMDTRFSRFLAHINQEEADGVACNLAYTQYLSSNPEYIDGAQSFLRELRKRGRVYIVTNGTSYIQKQRFEICNLEQFVDGVFVSENIGYDKPAKEFSDFVYAHIPQFEKARAIWIGDSLSADILCANHAKTDSIWFNPHKKQGNKEIFPTYTVFSFSEILEILDRI